MFDRDRRAASGPGRYRMRIVSGQLRQKSHQSEVQAALDEGGAQGWRLVSATTTNASCFYVTGIFWDTLPER